MSQEEEIIHRMYRAALVAVEPSAAVRAHLRCLGRELMVNGRTVPVRGRLFVVGAGKAAVTMARGVETVCSDLIDVGMVVTKDGHTPEDQPVHIAVREAAHPIPDQRGVDASREILDLISQAGPDDVVLALISGGGSALLEAPRSPVTLDDMARTTDLLLRAGAPIQDLNAVRIPLSLVKGGGLRRAAGRASVMTLIVSDVLGNDPHVIASGPTVPGSSTGREALEVLDRFSVHDRVPKSVLTALVATADANDNDGTLDTSRDAVVIVADNAVAIDAAKAEAERSGLSTEIVWTARSGEARDLAREWVEVCQCISPDTDVLLGGGEATVTVRGDGVGGRNTEFALAAALALEATGSADWTVASLASDGDDGAAKAAGAIADAAVPAVARERRVDPSRALENNDSATVFERVGGLVRPGPTGTNVNDLYFAVRHQPT